MKKNMDKYKENWSEENFWQKLTKYAKQAGLKVVYTALLLFYAFRRKETPTWAKSIIIGVLGYFLTPFDALPDLTPLIGYTDDLGVLAFGLATVSFYVNKEVKEQARGQLHKWFGEVDEEELKEVDEQV